MAKVLGIDTSNYTTSIAVVDESGCLLDSRIILKVKNGERGLRQSEALFQHINNLPELLKNNGDVVKNPDAICVSTRPRPVEGSYMPVFKAGESLAEAMASISGARLLRTTHQEGHIEAAIHSLDRGFFENRFLCFHLSGGTTEILLVDNNGEDGYQIDIIGKTKDISAGQLIDRVGVALGQKFPCGRAMDELAMDCTGTELRIPSRTDGLDMNFSGQETLCLRYVKDGYNQKELAYALMLCISKTLEKTILRLNREYGLPILFSGGVSSSNFIGRYLTERFGNRLYFAGHGLATDNAVGAAFIGYKFLGKR